MDNIILIGFMGSGKTTIGKYMEKCGYSFIDTDEFIEAQEQDSISNIFATKGEDYFRNLETECIQLLIGNNTSDSVISVGGGLPMKSVNHQLLKELGKVVYLRANADTLVNRLIGDTKRPLLQGGDLREKITSLMNKRESTYEAVADVIIDTDNCPAHMVYDRIKERL
jgi:shikimate kinase